LRIPSHAIKSSLRLSFDQGVYQELPAPISVTILR
jgi:hypothetical protein